MPGGRVGSEPALYDSAGVEPVRRAEAAEVDRSEAGALADGTGRRDVKRGEWRDAVGDRGKNIAARDGADARVQRGSVHRARNRQRSRPDAPRPRTARDR